MSKTLVLEHYSGTKAHPHEEYRAFVDGNLVFSMMLSNPGPYSHYDYYILPNQIFIGVDSIKRIERKRYWRTPA